MSDEYTFDKPYVSKMQHRPMPLWKSLVWVLEGTAVFVLAGHLFSYYWWLIVIYAVYCLEIISRYRSKRNDCFTDVYTFDSSGIRYNYIDDDPGEYERCPFSLDFYLRWSTMQWIRVSSEDTLDRNIELEIHFKNGKKHNIEIERCRMPKRYKEMMIGYSGRPDLFRVPKKEK